MIDMLRLNYIVSELLAPGDAFDPELASELRAAVPVEPRRWFSIFGQSTSAGYGTSGHTDHQGNVTVDDYQTKRFSFNRSAGLCVGKWRVVRDPYTLTIEDRNADTKESDDPWFQLVFSHGRVNFFQLTPVPRTVSFLGVSIRIVTCKRRRFKDEGGVMLMKDEGEER